MTNPILFVSHVSENHSAAMELVEELERRGIPCWIAPRDVQPGEPFDDAIATAIETCRAMLLVFSDHCNRSQYIRREVTFAGDARKLVIPLRIEKAEATGGLRMRLSDLHWIDAFAAREQAIDAVVRSVDSSRRLGAARPLRGGDAPESPSTAPPPAPASPKRDDETVPEPALPIVASMPRAAPLREPPRRTAEVWSAPPVEGSLSPHEMLLMTVADEVIPTDAWNQEARSILDKARQGDAAAQYRVGFGFKHGPYENKNEAPTGAGWVLKAASGGVVDAMNCLGDWYFDGFGVMKDYARALQWRRAAVVHGSAESYSTAYASYAIGHLYECGYGVAQSYQDAAEWFARAFQYDTAKQRLEYHLIENGIVLAADREHAGSILVAGPVDMPAPGAASAYEQFETTLLGVIAKTNTAGMTERERSVFDRASDGDPVAQYNLGRYYLQGRFREEPFEVRLARCTAWMLSAARQGLPIAEERIGFMYSNGNGSLPIDKPQAFRWLMKAAERPTFGVAAWSRYAVAQAYEKGTGVHADLEQALAWYRRAADNGYDYALTALARVAETRTDGKADPAEAVSWYRKGVASPYISRDACMALGRLTEEGMGIEKDLQEAAGWYAKAGRLGTALDALQRLKNEHGITPSTMANPLPS